jgi:guanyl-specific ribonuclease Sa
MSVTSSPGIDPLDPQRLNRLPTPEQQQRIADTLNTLEQGTALEKAALNPHPYMNYPSRATGAVLPASPGGYTSYDVPTGGSARGTSRLIIDNATGATYFTHTHYDSFYPVVVKP